MKNLILILVLLSGALLLLPGEVEAQQDAEYSQYMFNTMVINPAYTGSRGVISITGLFREQWSGIDGNPTTGSFSIHGPLKDSNSALGLWAEIDEIGLHNQIRIFGTYAYHVPLNNGSKLSLGLQAGGRMYKFETDDATADTEILNINNQSQFLPNAGIGLYLYNKMYFVGLSAPHLFSSKLLEENEEAFNDLENHYYATAGVVLPIGEQLKFKPTALLKYVKDAPLSLDLTAHFLIRDMLWLGAAWRAGDSVDFLAEIQATDQIRVGYAYDLTTSELADHDPQTHEVMLGYDFCYKQCKTVTPRYF